MKSKIAYIMSRFPHLPETFILREMIELERQGFQICLYPLIFQEQAVVHQDAEVWAARAERVSFLSPALLVSNLSTLVCRPGKYLGMWAQALWENLRDLKFLVRTALLLPKATHFARLMQQEGVAHIHAHYATHPALVAWAIHRLSGITYSVTVHAHDIFVSQSMLGSKLGEAAFVVAISKYNVDFLARLLGDGIREKCHVVHCGIVPEAYHPRRKAAGDRDGFEIINIGSLQPYKGQRYLVEACAMLRAWGIPFRCRIIGEGEERPQLEAQIADLDLEPVVELLGPLPQREVARILPEADCYVQSSIVTPSGKMEGIPVALMEAMACEVPAVSSDISGIPELVRPEQTGYLVPPADARALADVLKDVYENPAQAYQLATAGRQLVLDEFELSANVAQLASLLEAVVGVRQSSLAPETNEDVWQKSEMVPS